MADEIPLENYPDDTHKLLTSGLDTYDFMCSKCHGKALVNPGTSSFDLRKWPTADKDGFSDSVLNGKGDMPAWADVLYPGELDALWAYVVTRGGTEPFPDDFVVPAEAKAAE